MMQTGAKWCRMMLAVAFAWVILAGSAAFAADAAVRAAEPKPGPPASDELKKRIHAQIEALKDEDWLVRSNAAIALGKIGAAAKDAVPALKKALEDEDPSVRDLAAEALSRIQRPAEETP
jgi:HEAT repeat protein